MNPALAFDRSSARTFDADGRLHVDRTNISKSNVCPYYGNEIPDNQALGLNPEQVYRLYRDPDELTKAASTFNNLPLLRRHVVVNAAEPQKDDVVGSIGSDVAYSSPYLSASLCVWDAEAIAAIESGALEELSSAYRYTADMTPGTSPDGEAYDGVMRDIIGNHLALVEVGRAGPDVVVADSNPFKSTQELPAMKSTKLGKALLVALSAASPKIAQDSGLPALVGGAKKADFDKAAVRGKLVAMDADIDPEQLDSIIDAILGVEQNPEPQVMETAAADGYDGAHGEVMDYLRSAGVEESVIEGVVSMLSKMSATPGMDEEEIEAKVEENVGAAMDAMRKEFRDLEQAKAAVQGVVGNVLGMDSAEQVYRFALDHLKVDHKTMPAIGLPMLFSVACDRKSVEAPSTFAQDSAAIAEVPGLDRFKTI